MQTQERRQHLRVDDRIYFDYHLIEPSLCLSEQSIIDKLLNRNNELHQYFEKVDQEIATLTAAMHKDQPIIAQCLELIGSKVDCLARNLLVNEKTRLKKVNLSLGGMAFKTKKVIAKETMLKMVIYTKPKMIPILVDAKVVYSDYISETQNKTAVVFERLTAQQEELLSQHILMTQMQMIT